MTLTWGPGAGVANNLLFVTFSVFFSSSSSYSSSSSFIGLLCSRCPPTRGINSEFTLSFNAISGSIPTELLQLPNLQYVLDARALLIATTVVPHLRMCV